MRFTVLGGKGFIGRHLVEYLESVGHDVLVPDRSAVIAPGADLGHVIYCIGLTADFRRRPLDTIDAHVNTLTRLMQAARYQSWLYLSTTRLYGGLGPDGLGREDAPISVLPSADSLYDLSKLLGEAYCLSCDNPHIRVARLANVYGPGQGAASFLGSVIEELQHSGSVVIHEDPQSSKDYIAVEDVVRLLVRIGLDGRDRIYNVASGMATSHQTIADNLMCLTDGSITFAAGGAKRIFPRIDIARINSEFGFTPGRLVDHLPDLLQRTVHKQSRGTR